MFNKEESQQVLRKLIDSSNQYISNPTPQNRERFFGAVRDIKRLERQGYIFGDEIDEIVTSIPSQEIAPVAPPPTIIRRNFYGNLANTLITPIITVLFVGLLLFYFFDTSPPTPANQQSDPTLTPIENTISSICGTGGSISISEATTGEFRRDLGMTIFDSQATLGAILDNRVRSIGIDNRGVWIGYYPLGEESSVDSISQFNRERWETCEFQERNIGQRVNDITIGQDGRVWVATDGFGVAVYDGNAWQSYTEETGLASNQTYQVVIDEQDNVWVATWQGVSKFDGNIWNTVYNVRDGDTLIDNHVHSIAFHPQGEIWVGYVDAGLSRFTQNGEWLHYTSTSFPSIFESDNVRSIAIDEQDNVWIAIDGGGVIQYDYSNDNWSLYSVATDSLTTNNITVLAIDQYDRIWVGSDLGVFYLDGDEWQQYTTIQALDIAFGPNCNECPYDNNDVWIASEQGLAHAHIPPITDVVRIVDVEYPDIVSPSETFNPRFNVRVLTGYQLDSSDGLFFTERSDNNLFGAWSVIPVDTIVNAGQTYEFYDYENPFTAPSVPGTYSSTWRVWQNGRFVGPDIVIEFTVVDE